MKLKHVYMKDGTVEEIPIFEDGEVRSLDFSDEIVPPTLEQRRAQLAQYDSTRAHAYREALGTFLVLGKRGLDDEQRSQTTTTTGGGFLIQEEYYRRFIATMQQQDQLLAVGTMITTPTGGALTVPVDDDVVIGETVNESGASTADAVTFDSISFVKCPKKGSKILRVPLELLQDAFTTFDSIIGPILARRVARAVAADAIATLITDSDVAVVAAGTSVILPSEVLDLMGSLDAAHSQVGAFLMNETTLTALKKFTANTSAYFPTMIGTDSAGRTTVFGKPVYSSPSMDSPGADKQPIAFGNLSRFYFRSVAGSLQLQRLDERYAEFGQAGFQIYWRCHGHLAKSASAPLPIRFLANHS